MSERETGSAPFHKPVDKKMKTQSNDLDIILKRREIEDNDKIVKIKN